jgi:hypothetical protein
MRVWKGFVGLAAAVVLGCSGVTVLGDDTNSNTMGGDQNAPPEQIEEPAAPAATPAAPATTSYGALMQGLEEIGIGKPMESLGFNIHGYVEGGYLYDITRPTDQTPARTAPGDDVYFAGPYKNAVILDQLDLTIERDMVNLPKGNFDFGFKVEAGYGRDDYYTHSVGILDQHNEQGGTGLDDQLDLLQAYVEMGIPLGTGADMEMQAGKFVGLLGYETIDPTQNLFYSHSYGFSYGRPYTMTGVLGKFVFSDETNTNKLAITGGVTEGWNQSLRTNTDHNGDADGVVQLKATNDVFEWTANMMFGPMGVLGGSPDYGQWWWVPELIGTVHVSKDFSISGDFLYGDAPGQAIGGLTAQWFSAAGYVKYQVIPQLSLGTRIEYYHDGRGTTTGVGPPDVNYWEATVGAVVTPFPDSPWLDGLAIRPEVRCDWADQPVLDVSSTSFTGRYSEVTAAIDVYFKF